MAWKIALTVLFGLALKSFAVPAERRVEYLSQLLEVNKTSIPEPPNAAISRERVVREEPHRIVGKVCHLTGRITIAPANDSCGCYDENGSEVKCTNDQVGLEDDTPFDLTKVEDEADEGVRGERCLISGRGRPRGVLLNMLGRDLPKDMTTEERLAEFRKRVESLRRRPSFENGETKEYKIPEIPPDQNSAPLFNLPVSPFMNVKLRETLKGDGKESMTANDNLMDEKMFGGEKLSYVALAKLPKGPLLPNSPVRRSVGLHNLTETSDYSGIKLPEQFLALTKLRERIVDVENLPDDDVNDPADKGKEPVPHSKQHPSITMNAPTLILNPQTSNAMASPAFSLNTRTPVSMKRPDLLNPQMSSPMASPAFSLKPRTSISMNPPDILLDPQASSAMTSLELPLKPRTSGSMNTPDLPLNPQASSAVNPPDLPLNPQVPNAMVPPELPLKTRNSGSMNPPDLLLDPQASSSMTSLELALNPRTSVSMNTPDLPLNPQASSAMTPPARPLKPRISGSISPPDLPLNIQASSDMTPHTPSLKPRTSGSMNPPDFPLNPQVPSAMILPALPLKPRTSGSMNLPDLPLNPQASSAIPPPALPLNRRTSGSMNLSELPLNPQASSAITPPALPLKSRSSTSMNPPDLLINPQAPSAKAPHTLPLKPRTSGSMNSPDLPLHPQASSDMGAPELPLKAQPSIITAPSELTPAQNTPKYEITTTKIAPNLLVLPQIPGHKADEEEVTETSQENVQHLVNDTPVIEGVLAVPEYVKIK